MLLTCCQITQLLWRQVYFSILQLFQSFVATVTTFWNVLLVSDFKWGYNFQKQSRYSVSTFDTLSLCYLISQLNIGFQCIASRHIVFLHFTQPQNFFGNRAALCVCLTVTHNNGYTVMCEQIWVCSFVMWYLVSICDKLMCGSDFLMHLLESQYFTWNAVTFTRIVERRKSCFEQRDLVVWSVCFASKNSNSEVINTEVV